METGLAASTTQSAAESEEDLLRLQQTHPHMHSTAASSGGAFSTSSVDQFLRDNGFELDASDDVLSSSANSEFGGDASAASHSATASGGHFAPLVGVSVRHIGGGASEDDAAAAVDDLLRADAIMRRRDRGDEDIGNDGDNEGDGDGDGDVLSSDDGSHLSGVYADSTAAGEEGDLPPPRFILLDDEELLLSMSHEPLSSPIHGHDAREWRRPDSPNGDPQRAVRKGSSFDRSMLLGGSGLSALSEERSQSSSHHTPEPEATRAYRRLPPQPRRTQPVEHPTSGPRTSLLERLVASSPSSSSSASYASSPRASASSASSFHNSQQLHEQGVSPKERSRDDELSDALGVGSSVVEAERTSPLDSRPRLEPRRLSPQDDDEQKDATALPPTHGAANPWTRSHQSEDGGEAPLRDGEREIQKAQWTDLNILLRKNGLSTLTLREVTQSAIVPDHASMINLVQDLLLQLGQKNEAIQDLVIDSNRTYKVHSKAEGDVATLERKGDELRRSLQNAQNETTLLQKEVQRQKDETDKQTKSLKAAVLKLQQQLKVSEHRVKAKEVIVERMQKKVQQQVDKENLNKTRDRKIFKQLQQRDPRKANAADNQSLECISVYETQREQMQQEIGHLRSQVAALNGELREKENSLSRHSSFSQISGRWSDAVSDDRPFRFDASDDMLVRLEAARRDQEQAAAKLRQREAIMVKKVSAIEDELLAARDTIAELKVENANLTLEAESRPSIRDYRLSQRRIHQLERQLSEQKLALEEANDINELRRFMGTTELIERDRLNHRLYLNRLGTLPKETLLEVVKEVCRVLNLTDITLITPSLHKLCNVVTAVPRMEQFIRDVCGFVYFNTASDADNQRQHDEARGEENARFELEQVLPTLQQWRSERRKLFELEGFKTAIVTELCKRSVEPSFLKQQTPSADSALPTPLSNLPRAVRMVVELVELEKSVMHHKEIYTHAAEELERRPNVLVNQIVRHFSHVFHVKQIDGVLPRINEIYLFVNEMENFLKAIRSLLVLKPTASPVICIDAIRSLVEGEPTNAPARPDDAPEGAPNYVVHKATRGRVDAASGSVEGVRQVREMSVLIRDLKKELGAATMHEILPRTRRLMELLSLSIHQSHDDDDF